ncbi:glycosyltransferase family 10 [Polaribacter sp. Z014]|uniref:glycosyltransferase family 10 domain-containing protein n=1 Tax=Polaribacter sp. Z014 TaxID=2927126 RepID=UPI002021D8CD|nr:glycosyltransferase family 10 [Polaribacter sp. Z014]MCL7763384.1 glycosyltransferase family 10 [Polaribacter sp. Z014]
MMININILTRYTTNNFLHQLDKERFGEDFEFFENSKENIFWDVVVVYEGITLERHLKVKKGGLIFISGEPPMSSVYPKKFLQQFDQVLSAHPKLKHSNSILSQQALNWHFGFNFVTNTYKYDFKELKEIIPPNKIKNISIISSSKKMMPGHNKRMKLIKFLKDKFPGEIDYFGKGINPVDDKADAILPYKFHICIENSFIDDYWSEKFADPILGYSVPIYIGCTNIKEYFTDDFYYNFNIADVDKISELITDILKDPEVHYNNKIGKLKIARKKLLQQYNIFPLLVDFYKSAKISKSEIKSVNIKPSNSFGIYSYLFLKLRAKRLIYKLYLNFFKN